MNVVSENPDIVRILFYQENLFPFLRSKSLCIKKSLYSAVPAVTTIFLILSSYNECSVQKFGHRPDLGTIALEQSNNR
ncbi:hypothetical protein RU98_GL002324 [Enterococcus caccae]|nr:hypothetical protein RU98_GL002324 [Enterococcus caccae]